MNLQCKCKEVFMLYASASMERHLNSPHSELLHHYDYHCRIVRSLQPQSGNRNYVAVADAFSEDVDLQELFVF